MEEMFCFQCQQTAHNTGCEGHIGVCGKKSDTANLQDELTGELIRLASAVAENERSRSSDELMLKGLFTTITNVNFNSDTVKKLSDEIREEAENRKPGKDVYNVQKIWEAPEDIRSLKSLILFGLRGTAAYAYHAWALGYVDAEIMNFFYKGMRILGEEKGMEELLPVVIETGKINLRCMELLDKANTESYGDPIPTEVPLTIEKGPFIVFFFSTFSCVVTLPWLLFDYHPMSLAQIGILLFAGLSAAGGQFSITAAYCYAPAREISVYDYSQIIFSAGLGFFFFEQIPDLLSWIGYAVICLMAVAMFLYNNRRTE